MRQKVGITTNYPETVLYHRLPPELYNKIIEFMNKRRYTVRTSAINDLLSIALIVVDNLEKIEDPELVRELRAQIHEGDLVKYVQTLNPHQLEVLWSSVDKEVKKRTQQFNERYHMKNGGTKF